MRAMHDGNLKNFMAAITPGGIEAQEKAGQMEEAERETLPADIGQKYKPDVIESWKQLGFIFGAKVDDIFVEAKFPDGWKKRPTDHSMWSEIIDGKGRVRGMIFYKAAFYDRSAHARLTTRFSVRNDYERPLATVSVKDANGEVDFKVTGLEQPDWEDRTEAEKRQTKQDQAFATCVEYLRNNYPDFENPCAYWE